MTPRIHTRGLRFADPLASTYARRSDPHAVWSTPRRNTRTPLALSLIALVAAVTLGGMM